MIVIGAPAKDRAWALPAWLDAIEAQGHDDIEIVCVVSQSEDDTELILKERGVTIIYDERPGRPMHEIDGHMWGLLETYEYMTSLRNILLETAKATPQIEAFFSLDTDIVLPPGALDFLLETLRANKGVVSPAVNMGSANDVAWNMMTWNRHRTTASRPALFPVETARVNVVMAAMLMDSLGMKARWHAHPQGEDLGFCLAANRNNVPLWWAPEVRCDHMMRRRA